MTQDNPIVAARARARVTGARAYILERSGYPEYQLWAIVRSRSASNSSMAAWRLVWLDRETGEPGHCECDAFTKYCRHYGALRARWETLQRQGTGGPAAQTERLLKC